jgi:hypothetical protein
MGAGPSSFSSCHSIKRVSNVVVYSAENNTRSVTYIIVSAIASLAFTCVVVAHGVKEVNAKKVKENFRRVSKCRIGSRSDILIRD